MKILVVGGGGREHAIIKSLKKSPRVTEVYAALSKDFVLHAGAHCRHRLLACHGHGDAFAQGKAIGLNHSGDGGGL